jgi:HD superfamily phosphodiesterase
MNERTQLEHAMQQLEGQRAVLGDAVVDAALQPLREQLSVLDGTLIGDPAQPSAPEAPTGTPSPSGNMPARYERAFEYARRCLQENLPQALQYHNANHTLNEVVVVCTQLAEMEDIPEPQRWLLLTAAYFHDLGLTRIEGGDPDSYRAGRAVHEEKGAEIARSILPGCGFDVAELEDVCSLILSSRWGHTPTNLLEQILQDADLSSIGADTDYYMATSFALRRELAAFGIEIDEIDWLKNQVKVLSSYQFHTASARSLFDANRLQNVVANQVCIESIRNTAGPA